MDDNTQTSEAEEVIDGEAPAEQTPTDPTTQETGTREGQVKEPEVDYKVKFSESAREAQRLYEETKTLKQEKAEALQRAEAERKEREELLARLKDENPEAFDALSIKKNLSELQREVLTQKEEREVNDYLSKNPQAVAHKEALKRLGRAEPKKSYDELWSENFAPVMESGRKLAEQEYKSTRAKQPETGKGSISKDPASAFDVDEFNKLTLAQRKEILKKQGF